jgi:hypothetical protein
VKMRQFFTLFWCATALLFLSVSKTGVHAAGCLPLSSPWTAADIGDVGVAGNTCVDADGTPWTVSGAGADIWGTADAFQFAYRPFPADGSIVVKLNGEHDTDPFAKAGIMIRQTLAADSAHVILDVKPDGGIEFMMRPTSGASTTFIAGASTPVFSGPPGVSTFFVTLKLERNGDVVTASVLQGNSTWTVVGTTAWTSGPAMIGLAVTSHDPSTLNAAPFDIPTVTVTTTPPLPDPWQQSDVGTTGLQGGASYSNGVLTVSGSGSDIWGSADSFHFVYSQIGGDGQIVARVTSTQNTNPYAKAGVMIRESLDASASDVVLDLKPDGSVEFMARGASGADTTFIGTASQQLPGWLKLVRSGGTVSGYVSSDGATWSKVGDATVSLPSVAYIGLAVTSHDPSLQNTSTFDNVLIDWSSQDIGNVGQPGSAAYANFTYTINAAGSDIWGTADSFRYLYMPFSTATVHAINGRVDSLQNTNPFAKAGVMMRGSLAPDAATVILDVTPDGNVEFMARSVSGAPMMFIAGATTSFPAFLRLNANGQSFSGYVCQPDGTCSLVGATGASISSDGFIGLAVTSHDPNTIATAAFGRVTVDP